MKLWVLAFILTVPLLGCSKHPEIKRLMTKDGYEVRILGESSWEYQESFYYEVWKGKTKVVDLTFLDTGDGTKCFIKDSEDMKSILIVSEDTKEILAKIEKTNRTR